MLFTIHRYVFRDLLKIFFLVTVVLSVVLGLGVMLRPLRQFSVDPSRVPELVLCTLPITMTMVLPIAALLATTLVYGRLAVDNEINACRSSGIGLLTLIYPAFTLALLVGVATLLLAFHVIPAFIARSESIIKTDAEAVIYRNIEKKGNLGRLFPDIQIYADRAWPEHHMLSGVAVLQLNLAGVERMITARQVKIEIQQGGQTDQIQMRLFDYDVIDVGSEEKTSFSGKETLFTKPLPRLLQDSIKFKKLSQLKAIREDMSLFSPVGNLLEKVRRQLLIERFFEWCEMELQQKKFLDLDYQGQGRLHIDSADGSLIFSKKKTDSLLAADNKTASFAGAGDWPIRVARYHRSGDQQAEKIYQSHKAKLIVDTQLGRPYARLVFDNVKWNYPGDNQEYNLGPYDLYGINLPEEIVRQAQSLSLRHDVLPGKIPLLHSEPSACLVWLYEYLRNECDHLAANIRGELHSRLAFGVSCVVLVLIGAALGIIFRSGHLLTAFGISFIPATLCLITVFTGKHIAEQNPQNMTTGIIFLWSGIIVVAVANAIIYKLLLRR